MKKGKVTQRSSTRIGVYKMAPMSMDELEKQIAAGNICVGVGNIGKRVEEKLREAAWSIDELADELDLNKKQVSNAIKCLRDNGVNITSFSTVDKSLYAIRGA